MNFGTYLKQPADVMDYDLDYSEWLTPGDNVDSTVIDIAPSGALEAVSVFVQDPRIKLWLSGGTTGTTYKVTATTTTADGRIKQDEFRIKVKDI